MMQSFLLQAGYISNAEADIWSRPEYCSITYSDGDEVEQRIEQIVRSTKDLSVLSSELRSHCTDWPSLYHLSGVRANILRPFESDLNGHILEVGAGCGAISRYLGECGATVLALEGSLRRAAIARLRTRDQPNVMVVAEQFDQFLIDQKFDVITLIGVLEYANLFAIAEHPALAMLEHARSLLKPNGKLIIAIENQLGLKYFAGAPEDHLGQAMYGIEGRYQIDEPQTFGCRFLSELIHQAGFAKSEFLIPFPDYKLPVCILTAEGLNAPDFDATELACQSITKDAQLPERTLFSLERSLPVVFLNGLAVDLANSFLIVAANSSEDDLRSGPLAYYFSTDRRSGFCKETTFVRSDESILVKRRALPTNSFPEPVENSHLFFQPPCDLAYFQGKTLYRKFVEIVTRPDWAIKEIQHYFSKYLEIILEIVRSEGHLCSSELQDILLPGDYLDAIPSNIVITDGGKAVYIDREWCALQGISLDYLLFRAITSLMKGISTFSQPQDPALATRGGFLLAVMNSLGFSPTDEDFSRFLWMESELGIFASGVESRVFTTWSPAASLPGCSGFFPGEVLESRLKRTELAKSVAEKFAYERLAEIQRLQTQLVATEEAKDYAESLAIDRLQELQQLQSQLTQTRAQLESIQSSRGYKLLKIIRLDPNRRRPDV
ncbi:MAG: class I SAM-dependent methyltransferase [Nitrosomonas sp.]|uniref:class I SAM-dependent methyltransferase n=1 Tax=Nitrosomonas sp. TaxID=42353 RepID=UPI0025D7EBD7|nr:class I SAM-dependent methyltransferase [Nitrosomonas sp.]MBY0475848.1 class I SAM-dependent methyltransferase [Nitrosomonas sp.]